METVEDGIFSVCWGIELGQGLLRSWGLLSSLSCFHWGWWSRDLLLLGSHMDHKAHRPFAVAKPIVITGNVFDRAATEGNASPASKVKVGVSLLKSQEAACPQCNPGCPLGGPLLPASPPSFSMSSHLVAFSRPQVRFLTHWSWDLGSGRPCQWASNSAQGWPCPQP